MLFGETLASQLTVGQTGFAVPWHCFIDADGFIRPHADASIMPAGGGTRCIHVICLADGYLLGSFAQGVTQLSFCKIRKYFNRRQ